VSEKQWRQHHWSSIKIDFIKRHAYALKNDLLKLNINLKIIKVPDYSAQLSYLKAYCLEHNIELVIANSELEINEVLRDKSCIEQGISLTLFESDVVVPKGKVLNQSGKMYKVFTPFKRAWLRYVQRYGFDYFGKISSTETDNLDNPTISNSNLEGNGLSVKWPLGSDFEQIELPLFFQNKIADYADVRDIPSIKGTSGISPYLAAGVISPRYILRVLLTKFPDILIAEDSAEFPWLNEIIWREFYRHLMFHEPRLCKNECFNSKYQNHHWNHNEQLFKQWCEGKTGYPLVDAAMRQLNQTGWMHNRLRMVVASFLTKHLLIDWRLGEKYFMQNLIDGDLASNNGGWQWAASTGCDAQPYFRVFNPIRQSERFDPKGDFIRKYLPELNNIPDKHIHFQHKFIKDNNLNIYWPAIVEHKEARLKALAFYK
jgi:deoxyribodipyrimidine photo-lyase